MGDVRGVGFGKGIWSGISVRPAKASYLSVYTLVFIPWCFIYTFVVFYIPWCFIYTFVVFYAFVVYIPL